MFRQGVVASDHAHAYSGLLCESQATLARNGADMQSIYLGAVGGDKLRSQKMFAVHDKIKRKTFLFRTAFVGLLTTQTQILRQSTPRRDRQRQGYVGRSEIQAPR